MTAAPTPYPRVLPQFDVQHLTHVERLYTDAERQLQSRLDDILQRGPEWYREEARLRRLLTEARARMSDLRFALDERAIFEGLGELYRDGAVFAEGIVGERFGWGAEHLGAVDRIAADTFEDLLTATRYVEASAKQAIREAAKLASGRKIAGGRTAVQAGNALARELRENGIGVVTYRNGARHGVGEYARMVLRTKSAVAYNVGSLNHSVAAGAEVFEMVDGHDCGLSYHLDPVKANGLIVDAKTVATYPIAHPNCRRVAVPRRDLKPEDAGRHEHGTTPEQRADQAAFEKFLADKNRGRARRTPREPRPKLGPRAPRTPRAPEPPAPTPGPPVPEPPVPAPAPPVPEPVVPRVRQPGELPDNFDDIGDRLSWSASERVEIREALERLEAEYGVAPRWEIGRIGGDDIARVTARRDIVNGLPGPARDITLTINQDMTLARIKAAAESGHLGGTGTWAEMITHEYGHVVAQIIDEQTLYDAIGRVAAEVWPNTMKGYGFDPLRIKNEISGYAQRGGVKEMHAEIFKFLNSQTAMESKGIVEIRAMRQFARALDRELSALRGRFSLTMSREAERRVGVLLDRLRAEFDVLKVIQEPVREVDIVSHATGPAPGSKPISEIMNYEGKWTSTNARPIIDKLDELHGRAPIDDFASVNVRQRAATPKDGGKGGHFHPAKPGPKPRQKKAAGESFSDYYARLTEWRNAPREPEILLLSKKGQADEIMSFLHETGHRLDWNGTLSSNGPSMFVTGDGKATGEIRDALLGFRKAVEDSGVFERLKIYAGSQYDYYTYATSAHETFARAYSQWAAREIGGDALASFDVMKASWNAIENGYQWADDTFEPVAEALVRLLRARGMMK